MENFKKWLCAILALLVVAIGITCTKPQVETVKPSPTVPEIDEVFDHARSLNLLPSVISELKVLGPKMDEHGKAFIELLPCYLELIQVKLVRQVTADGKVSKQELEALSYLSSFRGEIQSEFIDLGLDACVLNFLTILSTLPDQNFAKYVVINKVCIGDGKLTDLESKFLREPEKYLDELFTQYLVDLGSIYPELADELRKLPDFEQANVKNLEAAEDVLSLALNPEHRTFFESALSEGIKDKRRYCTPLQALVWTAYDEEKFITTSVSYLVSRHANVFTKRRKCSNMTTWKRKHLSSRCRGMSEGT